MLGCLRCPRLRIARLIRIVRGLALTGAGLSESQLRCRTCTNLTRKCHLPDET